MDILRKHPVGSCLHTQKHTSLHVLMVCSKKLSSPEPSLICSGERERGAVDMASVCVFSSKY